MGIGEYGDRVNIWTQKSVHFREYRRLPFSH